MTKLVAFGYQVFANVHCFPLSTHTPGHPPTHLPSHPSRVGSKPTNVQESLWLVQPLKMEFRSQGFDGWSST